MPGFTVKITGKIATTETKNIVCDNANYTVTFDFDAEWAGAGQYIMRVITREGYIDTAFTGTTVTLPSVPYDGAIGIGVYTGNLITSTPAVLTALRSIRTDAGQILPPSPVFEEVEWGHITGNLENQMDLAAVLADKVGTADYDPVDKTAAMTQPVGKGTDGKLYTTPGSGGDEDSVHYTEDTDKTDAQKAQARSNIGAGTYSKPSGGIPASDIASGVIPTVPTNVSAFANDAGYLTQHQSLAAYPTSAAQDEIDNALRADIAAVGNGSPKGVYDNLAALQAAFPTGATGIYLTKDDGHWHYYTTAWQDGGVYRADLTIEQELGQSTTRVISQKVVTDNILPKLSKSDNLTLYQPTESFKMILDCNEAETVHNILNALNAGSAFIPLS